MDTIQDGFSRSWNENSRHIEKYSKDLAEVVLSLNEMQNLINDNYQVATGIIQSFINCPL
jgi:hypothetical protein